MFKHLKSQLAAAWIACTFYLLFAQFQLASPYYAFFALYRARFAFFLFMTAGITIAFAITLLKNRFTTRTLLLLTLMVSITLALGNAFYRNTSVKTGFAYSENQLTQCLSTGEIGDTCGVYQISDIIRSTDYTIIFTTGDRSSFAPCGFIKFSNSDFVPNHDSTELHDARFFYLGNGWHAFYSHYNSTKTEWS